MSTTGPVGIWKMCPSFMLASVWPVAAAKRWPSMPLRVDRRRALVAKPNEHGEGMPATALDATRRRREQDEIIARLDAIEESMA